MIVLPAIGEGGGAFTGVSCAVTSVSPNAQTAARCSSTRSPSCLWMSRLCCGRCRSGVSSRSAEIAPSPSMVRIVAATHRALREQVPAERFQEDLMYRWLVMPDLSCRHCASGSRARPRRPSAPQIWRPSTTPTGSGMPCRTRSTAQAPRDLASACQAGERARGSAPCSMDVPMATRRSRPRRYGFPEFSETRPWHPRSKSNRPCPCRRSR